MHFTQTTLALVLAATVAALPTSGSGGSPPPGGPVCSTGSNYCFQSGKLTEGQSQSCTTGDSYCCSAGGSGGEERVRRGLLGDNALNCVSALNGATISLPISAKVKRNEGWGEQGHPQGPPPTCDSGSNVCYQSGKATWEQSQDCSTGDSYCCSSGSDGIANCLNALNGAQVSVPITLGSGGGAVKRNGGWGEQGSSPSGPVCSSGSNYCAQDGKFTSGQTQSCSTGSSYCCSSKGGDLNCVNALNGLALTVPISITL